VRNRLAGLFLLTAGAAFAFPNPDGACSITTAGVLPQAVRGFPISYTISTAGCAAPMRFIEVRTGSLPSGMSLRFSGTTATVSGTPDTTGVFTFSVRAIDSNYRIPSKSFVMKVNEPLQIDTPAAATGAAGTAYTDTIRARGGVAPYTFSIVEGALPTGLTLAASTGVISGTMPTTGSQFRIRVTDSSSTPKTIERPFTIVPGGQITTVTAPPAGSLSTAYSFDLDGTLGATGFSQVLGTLPTGLTIDTNGLISGTPTAAGEFHFTVRQTVGTASVWRSYRILVNGSGGVTGAPPSAEEQAAYEHVFAASGGVAPYTFSVSAGALPTGITLDAASGALLGELPLGVGGSTFTISAVDASGRTFSSGFTIARVFRLQGSSVSPPTARVNQNVNGASMYSLAQGGTTKAFELIGGQGLGLIFVDSALGTVNYQIPTPGSFRPVVLGTDELGGAVVMNTSTVTVVGALAISGNSELPNTTTFATYNQTIPVANGVFTPLNFTVSSGALPSGLFLNASTGAITGSAEPGQSGLSFPFTITVTDAVGQTANRNYYIGVSDFLTITSVFVPGGTTGVPYSTTLSATGAPAPFWDLQSGTLPPGISLDGSGILSGTPTTPGAFTFVLQVTPGSSSEFDAKRFTINVANPLTATIAPASPAEARTESSIAATITTGGGRAPFSIAISGGGLPDGLYVQTSAPLGLQGVPNFEEARSFSIQVTDADSRFVSIPYNINVRQQPRIDVITMPPATRTVAFSQTLTATGGQTPYTWQFVSGALPPGITFSAAGVLSGTPTTNGSFIVGVTVTDASGYVDERNVVVEVTDAIAITNSVPLPSGLVLTPYNTPITTTGGAPTKVFSIASGDLPPLVAIDPATGLIANLPLVAGTYNFVVRASDSLGRTGSQTTQITVGGGIVISPVTVPNGTIGTSYSQALTATGAVGGVSWIVSAGTLPGGLTLSPTTGLLSGTPTTAGSFSFTVQATDTLSQVGTQSYTMTVTGALTISPATLPNGALSTAYSQTLTATGAVGGVSWIVSAGAIPAGLTLNPTGGVISGTPAAAGVYSFTVQATDSISQTGSQSYSVTVTGALTISPATLPNGALSTAYSQTLTATGAVGGVSWIVSAGAIPAGLTLNPTGGVISGTPTAAGVYSFTVQATDSISQTGLQAYSMTVSGTLSILPATLPNATVAVAYSQTLTASNNPIGTVTWTLLNGTLPTGLGLSAAGVISGTPTAAGAFTFSVQATDSIGQTGQASYSVQSNATISISPLTLPPAVIGTAYSQALTATGAIGALNWSLVNSTLPAGLTLNPGTGVISGTTTAIAGVYVVRVQVADAQSQTGQQQYDLQVQNPSTITPPMLPDATVGTAYSQTLVFSAAPNGASWSVSAGALPGGLTLGASTGVLSGTPATAGSFNFTVSAGAAGAPSATRNYTLLVLDPLTITTTTLPDGTAQVAYTATLATNSLPSAPITWTLTAGALPTGLTLSTAGVISGTPTLPGPYSFTVQAANSQGQTAAKTLSILVATPLTITTTTLPDGTEQEAYTATLTTNSAATIPVTWSVSAGSLPAGLSLTTAGIISGTPTASGTANFTARAAIAGGQSATQALSILVVPTLTITSTTLGDALQGRAYSTALTAAGGRTPYVWTLNGTTLPAGITLAANGVLSGTTSVAPGGFAQNVVVTDARGRVARKTLVLSVTEPPPPSLSISPDTIPNGRVGQAYSASFAGAGGTPGYTFSIAQGNPPPGLILSGGTLTGTPTQDGTFRFTVNVTDANGRVAGNQYAVLIEPALVPLSVTPSSIAPTVQVGQPATLQFGASGGMAPYTFAFIGTTPPGMSSNSAGLLSGTPSQGGTFTFTVEATDSQQGKASRSYSLTVTGNLTITTQPPLAEGTVGTAYSVTFGVAGGRAPYTWSITGTAPGGLTFADGTLSGTPTAAGTFPFTVEVRDGQRLTATAPFSITIFERLEITNGPADTPLAPGQAFNFAFSTRGGKAPVAFTLSGGALPAGLALNAAGAITGTPTIPGTSTFTVRATDALGTVATRTATFRVVATLAVATSSLPSGTVGVDYSSGVAATGGVAPLGAWSLSAGALPAGLALASDGTISGTPTAAGTANFTVRITDAAGTAATRALAITIALPPVPPISLIGLPQTLPPGTQTNITIQLAQPFPVTVTGTLTLVFEPNAVNNADDPAVQFSSGGRTVTFTIPAGQTAGTFPVAPLRILSGTVAGTIRIRTTTSPDSATPVPEATVPVSRSVPVITAGTAQLGTGTFTLQIDGFSNTREISAATVRLTPVAGAPLNTTDVPVSVAGAFTAYYQSAASAPFGGQFRLVLPFNVAGALNDIESATITVTNSVGTSQPFTVRLR
jgi:hypothetical protein